MCKELMEMRMELEFHADKAREIDYHRLAATGHCISIRRSDKIKGKASTAPTYVRINKNKES
jgi:hypothetical protein